MSDFISTQYVEVTGSGGVGREITINLHLRCTHHSTMGSFNPFDGGYPPEGAEFDLDGIVIVGSAPHLQERWIDLEMFDHLLGPELSETIFENACVDAVEQGGF